MHKNMLVSAKLNFFSLSISFINILNGRAQLITFFQRFKKNRADSDIIEQLYAHFSRNSLFWFNIFQTARKTFPKTILTRANCQRIFINLHPDTFE